MSKYEGSKRVEGILDRRRDATKEYTQDTYRNSTKWEAYQAQQHKSVAQDQVGHRVRVPNRPQRAPVDGKPQERPAIDHRTKAQTAFEGAKVNNTQLKMIEKNQGTATATAIKQQIAGETPQSTAPKQLQRADSPLGLLIRLANGGKFEGGMARSRFLPAVLDAYRKGGSQAATKLLDQFKGKLVKDHQEALRQGRPSEAYKISQEMGKENFEKVFGFMPDAPKPKSSDGGTKEKIESKLQGERGSTAVVQGGRLSGITGKGSSDGSSGGKSDDRSTEIAVGRGELPKKVTFVTHVADAVRVAWTAVKQLPRLVMGGVVEVIKGVVPDSLSFRKLGWSDRAKNIKMPSTKDGIEGGTRV